MRLSKAARLILVGAPGVGKGTQSGRLLKRFPQIQAISSGDLLRENVRNKTPLGIQVQRLMGHGSLVPDTMILRLITSELTSRGWLKPNNTTGITMNASSTAEAEDSDDLTPSTSGLSGNEDPSASFILDGFPRTAPQAAALDELVPINMVVHISTPKSIILDRIVNRWVHTPSGRLYNTTFNPPKVSGKDDVTGETLVRREDDSEEVWNTRLKKFEETSLPLLEHYDKLGLLWRVEGESSDEISPKLFAEFEQRFGVA
ncbi:MAG: hypothetical protein M1831_000373 [Alyxoria varia]|nr:MAG: hypothetical protein M1831_000373 [Alyxoria varia]